MNNHAGFEIELLYVVVNYGLGSKIMAHAKKFGVTGGTVFLGKGTIKNSFLEMLGINESRREILLMVGEKNSIFTAIGELNKKFSFHKKNHGIAFTVPVQEVIGARSLTGEETEAGEKVVKNKESRGVEKTMYNLIFVIVEKGNGEHVVEAANKAGSRGATIINGRGSGIHETSKLFSMHIEPEKEIVMIITQSSLTEGIVEKVREELKIDEPGKGIIFVQNVSSTCGLYEK